MNIMVIGLGSMGKRRIRLLKQYIDKEIPESEKNRWAICGVDLNDTRRDEAEKQFDINVYGNIEEAVAGGNIEVAVISTAPLSHASIIKECLNLGLHVFTEINLVDDGYDENVKIAGEKGKILFLSSTPIYRREMQYITKEARERGFCGTYRYHIGQYLPEWHPWENYKDYFVGDKRTNGCREIFAIELPWLTRAYGKIEECYSIHNKTTELELDYDDTYQVILRHETGVIGSLTVDVATPKTERLFSAWEEDYYLEWNGTPDSFRKMDVKAKEIREVGLYDDIEHVEGYNSFVVENAYYDELKCFISCIDENRQPDYSFQEDRNILKLIDEIMK